MNKLMTGILVASLGCILTVDALAQSVNTLISQRKGAMSLQQKYMSQLVNMVQGRTPFDLGTAQRNADILATLSTLPWDDFAPNTAGAPNSRAKDEVFKDAPKFKAATDKLQAETKALAAAAHGGNQATIAAAVKNTAMACNTCHDSFSGWNARFKFE